MRVNSKGLHCEVFVKFQTLSWLFRHRFDQPLLFFSLTLRFIASPAGYVQSHSAVSVDYSIMRICTRVYTRIIVRTATKDCSAQKMSSVILRLDIFAFPVADKLSNQKAYRFHTMCLLYCTTQVHMQPFGKGVRVNKNKEHICLSILYSSSVTNWNTT